IAKFTMRRERPPTFMISPASMKKGTASSGKLLAPSMVFCARICASNMFMCHISAAPQASSEKAMGTPSAMAPSRDPRKMAMVMASLPGDSGGLGGVRRLVFRLGNGHQFAVGELAGDQLPEVVGDEQRGEAREEHAAGVEEAHRSAHHGA